MYISVEILQYTTNGHTQMHFQYMSKFLSGTKQGQSFFSSGSYEGALGGIEKTDFRTS